MATGFTPETEVLRHSQFPGTRNFQRLAGERTTGGPVAPTSAAGRLVAGIFAHADIQMNGDRAWDIRVRDEHFYQRLLSESSLGAGESYIDEWWDVQALDEMFYRIQKANLESNSAAGPFSGWR
jgi:hypothetical protein